MLKYILKRILYTVFIFFVIIFILQILMSFLEQESFKNYFSTGQLFEEYKQFVTFLVNGHFVDEVNFYLKFPLFNTFVLNSIALIISLLISIPIGLRSAIKPNKLFDQVTQIFTFITLSIPPMLIGLVLMIVFVLKLRIQPAGTTPSFYEEIDLNYFLTIIKNILLPALTIALGIIPSNIRYIRSIMITILNENYIRTAKSKGLKEKVIVYKHAMRNGLIPLITLLTYSLMGILTGSIIVEVLFDWYGLGYVLLNAVKQQRYQIVLIINVIYVTFALTGNFIMDLSYVFINPRIKYDK